MADPRDNDRVVYEWEPWGAMFNSVAYEGAYLSVNYTDGVDTRWPNKAILGPALTALELTSTFGGTAANANWMERATTANGTVVAYGGRGTDLFKFKLGDLTLLDPSISLTGRSNSGVVIQTAAGNQQIAIGQAGANDYQVITTSANSGADTVVANSSNQDAEFIGLAPDRMVVLNKQQAYGNIIAGSVTASAPSLNSVNSLYPLPNYVTFTGFAVINGNQWIVGTNVGPYAVQVSLGRFGPLLQRIPPSADNCRAMVQVGWLGGVMIPLENQLRLQGPGGGERVGPEAYNGNTSPIQGIVMGADYDANWYICSLLNRQTSTYYFLAGRPRQPEDRHSQVVSWYCIGSTSTACELVRYTGTDGGRTLPAWWFGAADDLVRMDAGRTPTWIDDGSYTFSTTAQNLYLTELRAEPGSDLYLDTITLETAGCAASQTITVKWTADGGTQVTLGTINQNGLHRIKCPPGYVRGWRHAPQLVFSSNTASASPYTIGPIRCEFRRGRRAVIDGQFTPGDARSAEGVRAF